MQALITLSFISFYYYVNETYEIPKNPMKNVKNMSVVRIISSMNIYILHKKDMAGIETKIQS